MHLFKEERAIRHLRQHVTPDRANNPSIAVAFGSKPYRNLAWGAIGKHPAVPPPFVARKGASKFNGIDLEPLQHVLIHHGKLLDDIIHTYRLSRKAKVIA